MVKKEDKNEFEVKWMREARGTRGINSREVDEQFQKKYDFLSPELVKDNEARDVMNSIKALSYSKNNSKPFLTSELPDNLREKFDLL